MSHFYLVYKDSEMKKQEYNLVDKRAARKSQSLISPSVGKDIYATSSSSSSDGDCESTSKEHLLNSLHFLDYEEDMYELKDGEIVAPWTNSNEEEAPSRRTP
jgi:hypothetical protein